jgi:hypothetical protein
MGEWRDSRTRNPVNRWRRLVSFFSAPCNPGEECRLLLNMGLGDPEPFRTVWRREQSLILPGSLSMSPWLSSPEPRHYTDRTMPTEFGLVNYLEGPARLSKQNLYLELTACWSPTRTCLAMQRSKGKRGLPACKRYSSGNAGFFRSGFWKKTNFTCNRHSAVVVCHERQLWNGASNIKDRLSE